MLSAHPPARALVSYDDIASPDTSALAQGLTTPPGASGSESTDLPSKKRKRNNAYAHSHGQHSHGQRRAPTHWDDPEGQETTETHPTAPVSVVATKETNGVATGPAAESTYQTEEEEEGRMLTQEEMWDDSALVDAWKAAEEEYEALNGPDKAWKREPVNKSPLWYNKAPAPSTKGKAPEHHINAEAGPSRLPNSEHVVGPAEQDSQPLDFHTFVPSYDPSLAPARPPSATQSMPTVPFASAPIVSRDDAFQNAMSAMYWSGYWTAAYHYQNRHIAQGIDDSEQAAEEEEEAEVEEEVDMGEEDDLVSTQR